MNRKHIKILMVVSVQVSLYMLAPIADAQNFHFGSEIGWSTKIFVDGYSETAEDRRDAFVACRNAGSSPRGEYETKSEYEDRVAANRRNCETLEILDRAYLEAPARLSYDVDDRLFTFHILKEEDDHVRFDETFIGNSCVPKKKELRSGCSSECRAFVRWNASGTPQVSRVNSYSYKSRSGVHDCPNFDSSLDRQFFGRATLSLPWSFQYSDVRCSCTQKNPIWPRTCVKMRCDDSKLLGPREPEGARFVSVYSPVTDARRLKSIEDSLRLRVIGVYKVSSRQLVVKEIALINLEDNKVLFSIDPGS